VANGQKSAEIVLLNKKISEQELKIKEEENLASALNSQYSQYVEEIITTLKSNYQALE
jgi:hypothetical protein